MGISGGKLNVNSLHKTGLYYNRCYYCICRVCNLRLCRYRSRDSRCYSCRVTGKREVLDCDSFESLYQRRVYRIKRELVNKRNPSVASMVRDLWNKMKREDKR